MTDGKTLHFMKNFPASFLLAILFIAVLWLYLRTQDAFLQRVIDTILGGLLGVVTGRGVQQQTGNTTTGDVIVAPTENQQLKDLTTPEAINAVEQIKEEKL